MFSQSECAVEEFWEENNCPKYSHFVEMSGNFNLQKTFTTFVETMTRKNESMTQKNEL
jgi:hypothetical protein